MASLDVCRSSATVGKNSSCFSTVFLGSFTLGPTMSFIFANGRRRSLLIHLASRGATFRLQFIQRLLVGQENLVWRPLAHAILSQGGNLGLDQSLFLMDLKTHKLCHLPKFYQGLFTVWGMFKKSRTSSDSLFWLLKEPVLYGTRFNVEHLSFIQTTTNKKSWGLTMESVTWNCGC